MAMILRVALPVPLRRVFDYCLPSHLSLSRLQPGMRVKVSFGNRQMVGVFLETASYSPIPEGKLKPILDILDTEPLYPASLIQLCRWAADYYQYPLGEVLFQAIPVKLRRGEKAAIKEERTWQITALGREAMKEPDRHKKASRQMAFLADLHRGHASGAFSQAARACEKKGWVTPSFSAKAVSFPAYTIDPSSIKLNAAQNAAVQTILSLTDQFQCFLLDGITGSGKTEVYLSVIEKVLTQNKQALVLIPEIALTPQAIVRFQRRFNVSMVCLHSGLNETERLNAWLKVRQDQAKIIIGTRSAIFAPFTDLGIIIIDEEHDPSFKQQESFRYSARDLSIVRANFKKIPIVLGSATPSLETLFNTKSKNTISLSLPERTGFAIHPTYHFIDIRNQSLTHGLSEKLLERIQFHLDQNNQVMLFLNRRGYAPILMCHYCGWMADCHRCDTHLTLHKKPPHLRCHYCDSVKTIPEVCPQCGHTKLHEVGVGTERLELALQGYFPDVPIFRIDRDSTRRKQALNQILEKVQNGERQILIGTQMIAKGHHFPNVTLVGIVNADAGFFNADFRSIERAGQLLIQVAGRAGRAEKPGEVWIQTHHPEHPLLVQLTQKGYQSFAKSLLLERKESLLPPYSHLALLRSESILPEASEAFLDAVKTLAEPFATDSVMILGPIPSPIVKQKNHFRAQLLFQSHDRIALQRLLQKLIEKIELSKLSRQVKWSIDIDPIEMI